VASAQVKSAVLLAGLYADGETIAVEPGASRDHTERLLPLFGVEVMVDAGLSEGAQPAFGGKRAVGLRLAREGRPVPGAAQEEFARQREICDAEFLASRAASGCPADDPIFVVGLPRAGSTREALGSVSSPNDRHSDEGDDSNFPFSLRLSD